MSQRRDPYPPFETDESGFSETGEGHRICRRRSRAPDGKRAPFVPFAGGS